MKKKILKRILALTIVSLMIISTPFYISENINNNPYVYATTTFTQDLESQIFLQTLIPTLIAAGLVFKTDYDWDVNNGSQLHQHIVTESLKQYFENLGSNYKPPEEPDGPNLGEVIKEMLKGVTLVSCGYGIGKNIIEIPQMIWELVKSFVDDNYNVGPNIINSDYLLFQYENHKVSFVVRKSINEGDGLMYDYLYLSLNGGPEKIVGGHPRGFYNIGLVDVFTSNDNYIVNVCYKLKNKDGSLTNMFNNTIYDVINGNTEPYLGETIDGTEDIVDNPNYDWNNKYTDTKIIPIPIEMDPYGNPKKDENGYYLPSTDIDEWLDVEPIEIPNLNPTGTPIPDIPPFPDIENPNDDEQTGIMVYIGNILQIIVGQLSKIVDGVNTIIANTNQMIFGTPTPIIDPTTGQQIDPETGQPVIQEPAVEAGGGIIGDGIDTNIPTDFEWGDFRHLLDIFFIFIYFIVILILILLKFLQVVFTGLPGIAANTDLFTQYPTILEGVNYVKNLQVGGMSITVQQAFEYIFMIFFYIFVIKQIRKLYNAHVFEQSAENKRNTEDMKLDYYDKKKDNYENIKSIGWSDDK